MKERENYFDFMVLGRNSDLEESSKKCNLNFNMALPTVTESSCNKFFFFFKLDILECNCGRL